MQGMRTVKNLCLFLLVLALALSMAACEKNTAVTAGNLSNADDGQKITITGLMDEDFEVTVGEMKKLPTVKKRTEATRANGDKVKLTAAGLLLEDVLQEHGKSIKDYKAIRFTAKDGYSILVPPDILNSRQVILAYEIDGKRLVDEDQPVRVVIPGERAMYWVRTLQRIDLETGLEAELIKKVVFLETAVKNIRQEDYEHYGSVDQAIRIKELVDQYADAGNVKNVLIKAGDGLQKNESGANFMSAYIKITGPEAPKFIPPHLPQGMHVSGVLHINYGGTAFFSYGEGAKALQKQTAGPHTGIALSDIVKQTGLTGAERYKFSGAGGKSVELAANEMGEGLIYEKTPGVLEFYCEGAPEGRAVNDLLSIEALSQPPPVSGG